MIKVAFYKGKGNFIDWCIRVWTRSIYSHVELAIVHADGSPPIIVSSSGRDGGVRFKTYSNEKLNSDKWAMVDVTDQVNFDELSKFTATHHGKAYDFKGIFLSQFLPLKRHSKDKYFCSEFCAEALGFSQPHTYSPQGLYTALQQRG